MHVKKPFYYDVLVRKGNISLNLKIHSLKNKCVVVMLLGRPKIKINKSHPNLLDSYYMCCSPRTLVDLLSCIIDLTPIQKLPHKANP